MFKYILKRLGYMAVTFILVLTVNFYCFSYYQEAIWWWEKDGSSIAILEEKYGMNDPIPVQYARYLKGVFQGDLEHRLNYKTKRLRI